MSAYSGKQYKGASKDRRAAKKAEAELRNAKSEAFRCEFDGKVHRPDWPGCTAPVSPEDRLLWAIFGGEPPKRAEFGAQA